MPNRKSKIPSLKPCPFCGAKPPHLKLRQSALRDIPSTVSWLCCLRCETHGPVFPTPAEAARAWNCRALPDGLRESLNQALTTHFTLSP